MLTILKAFCDTRTYNWFIKNIDCFAVCGFMLVEMLNAPINLMISSYQ